ncbi:MAG: undecaprenyl-diphosphate phosphatase, partial [Candidatus Peribacteraceae bacterium]|nr:undecaprenyl-diphosphate phosphatase [Candidatus Peribacteraceae bacterium]
MTILHAIILGVLQGVTEFLPISSSGHLVLAELLFDLHIAPDDMQGLNILLHAGTLIALLMVYYETWVNLLLGPVRKDEQHTEKLMMIIIATLPAALIGFLYEEVIAMHFQSLLSVGLAFAFTGLVLILGECCRDHVQSVWHRLLHPLEDEPRKLSTRSAFFIGLIQSLALIPGLSRSGLTISAGRMMGLTRKDALDFSFLMAVPIIAGASFLAIVDLVRGATRLPEASITILAVAVSFVSSYGAILFIRTFVLRKSLALFTPYLFALS